jgi:hypothetical protein
MKKIFLFLISASVLVPAGCGNGKNDTVDTSVPQGMVAADLSEQGMPILINVPDSTVGRLQIVPNPQGGVDVKVGKNFQITILEGAGEGIDMKKKLITQDDVRKFVKYVVEEPNAIVWEWQMEGGEPEFHFYAIIKAGEKSYEVFDVIGEVFSEKAAMDMLSAAKSIRPKNKPST